MPVWFAYSRSTQPSKRGAMTYCRVSSTSTVPLVRTVADSAPRVTASVRTPSACTLSGGSTTVPGAAGGASSA